MPKQEIIQAPKGTADVLPAESWKWQAVEQIARDTARLYHFNEIRTPIFEYTPLFHRGVGETTDIVTKETFTFTDRGGDSITLRPEQTAGVVRAMIQGGLLNDEGARAKVFYIGPNFRYERPQKGRLRQHHQFGVEAFGPGLEGHQDVECMLLQLDFYRRCGITNLDLRINSLGDRESKAAYRDRLVEFLQPKVDQLSDESRARLETNPLRILDSKDPRDIEAMKSGPSAMDSLSDASRVRFGSVCKLLEDSGEKFRIDGTLVRGFDYYTDTVWEVTTSGLGSQNALGGGGRYDTLVETLGGRPTPAVGFGSGLERLLLALESQGAQIPNASPALVWLISMNSSEAMQQNVKLLRDLRSAGIAADMDFSGRAVKSQFKLADREAATIALITGDEELASDSVQLKDLKTGKQTKIARDQIIAHLRNRAPQKPE